MRYVRDSVKAPVVSGFALKAFVSALESGVGPVLINKLITDSGVGRFRETSAGNASPIQVPLPLGAEPTGVGPAEFGRAMAGDVIEHATTALLEELVSFSPNPRERAALRRVLDAVHRTREKARDRMEAWLDARLDKAMEEALASAGGSSGSAPASQASTPDR